MTVANDRAAKIARLQKIDQLQKMDGADPAQPGIAAIGSPSGPATKEDGPWYSPHRLGHTAASALPYAGQLAGEVGGGMVGAGAGGLVGGLPGIPYGMYTGAVTGGAAGMTAGEKLKQMLEQYLDDKQPDADANDKLKMAALNGGAGSLFGIGLNKALSSQALEKLANTSAFKALGPYAKAARQYLPGGKAEEIGKTMLDEGVVGGLPTSFKGVSERAATAKQAAGEDVGATLQKLANEESAPAIKRGEIAAQMREKLLDPNHGDVASIQARNDSISKLIQHFENGGEESLPILEAELKKRAVDKNINWMRLPTDDVPVGEEVDKALRGQLANKVEQRASEINPETATGFKNAKDRYDNLSKAHDITKQRSAHELAKQLLAPGIGGTVGFSHGNTLEERIKNMLYGVAGGSALRAGQLYGPQLVAPAARAASKMVGKIPADINPWSLTSAGALKQVEGE